MRKSFKVIYTLGFDKFNLCYYVLEDLSFCSAVLCDLHILLYVRVKCESGMCMCVSREFLGSIYVYG